MIYCNPSEEILCDACGEPVTYNPATYPNYDGTFHRRCANPEVNEDGLLIGYNNVVIGFDETALEQEPVEAPEHPGNCGCAWCTPLPWGDLKPAVEV